MLPIELVKCYLLNWSNVTYWTGQICQKCLIELVKCDQRVFYWTGPMCWMFFVLVKYFFITLVKWVISVILNWSNVSYWTGQNVHNMSIKLVKCVSSKLIKLVKYVKCFLFNWSNVTAWTGQMSTMCLIELVKYVKW